MWDNYLFFFFINKYTQTQGRGKGVHLIILLLILEKLILLTLQIMWYSIPSLHINLLLKLGSVTFLFSLHMLKTLVESHQWPNLPPIYLLFFILLFFINFALYCCTSSNFSPSLLHFQLVTTLNLNVTLPLFILLHFILAYLSLL